MENRGVGWPRGSPPSRRGTSIVRSACRRSLSGQLGSGKRSSTIIRFLVLAAALAATACSGGVQAEPHADSSANIDAALAAGPIQITLRLGEERQAGGSVLRLAFTQVLADSRCPIDAVCVWMGDGVVQLGITAGTGPTFPLELHTSLEPRSVIWNRVRVTLIALAPTPRASDPTRPEQYAVLLELERTE